MPCYAYSEPVSEDLSSQLRDTKRRLDKVTRLLCTTMKNIEKAESLRYYAFPELIEWWNEHKKADQKREVKVKQIRERH